MTHQERGDRDPLAGLGRREREIMSVLHRLGRASAREVRGQLPDPPGYSSVRKMLSLLEEKGHVRHVRSASRYLYEPTASREAVRRSALRHLLRTFFGGSEEDLVATLIRERGLTDEELDRIARRLRRVREDR